MATTTPTYTGHSATRLECGECGGHYVPALSADFICVDCGHSLNRDDFELDAGERLVLDGGFVLAVVAD